MSEFDNHPFWKEMRNGSLYKKQEGKMDKIDELKQNIKEAEQNLRKAEKNLKETQELLEQELKKMEPRYFVGQYLREKRTGKVWIILAYDSENKLYDCQEFFQMTQIICPGLYDTKDMQTLFDVIPYPWEEFIKVGDIYKDTRDGVEFTITEKDAEGFDTGNGYYYAKTIATYCIKIGESHEQKTS